MPGQEWARMWPNWSAFIILIPITFPESFIKIWWIKFEIYWKKCIFGQIWAKFGPKYWACLGKNGQSYHETNQPSFFSYQEHSLKVSSKSDESNSRYIGKSVFLDKFGPNLGLNTGHAWARMGNHVTRLTSLHSFHTNNIPWKFHQNLMNQIRDILEIVDFGTNSGLNWA